MYAEGPDVEPACGILVFLLILEHSRANQTGGGLSLVKKYAFYSGSQQ